MPIFTQIMNLMQAKLCARLVLESDTVAVAYHKDGTCSPTTEAFSNAEMEELLSEILPEDHRAPFEAGSPVHFAHPHNGNAVNVMISRLEGRLRISIELPAEPSPSRTGVSPSLPANPFIPRTVPFSLRWSDTGIRLFAATFGIVLGLGTSVAVYSGAGKQSLLGRMFNLDDVQALVPVSISCMFFWAATLCVLRWVRVKQAEGISSRSLLLDEVKVLSSARLPDLARELDHPACHASPLLRRVHACIRQWLIRPNLQDADLVLQQHVLTDEDAVRSGYSLVRIFVWALPVLGLIGTVIGISFAVGGFGQFLGGNVDDVVTIKRSLVNVTGGLSFAFLITLQGLLTSLLIMLPASALQTREERLYANVQRDISDLLLPALQRAVPEPSLATDSREQKAFRETLQRIAESVINKVGEISVRLVSQVDQAQSRQSQEIETWAQKLQTELEAGANRLGEVVGKLGKDLETASTEFLARLSLVRDSWDQHTTTLRQLVDGQAKSNSEIHASLVSATSDQTEAAKSICKSLEGFTDTTKTVLQTQTTLQAAIQQLSQAKFDETLRGVVAALNGISQQAESASAAVRGLVTTTGQALESQKTLQEAMRQLHEVGLPRTLAEFSDALKEVSRVLANFQEPIVFQAVRASRVLNAQGDGSPEHTEHRIK